MGSLCNPRVFSRLWSSLPRHPLCEHGNAISDMPAKTNPLHVPATDVTLLNSHTYHLAAKTAIPRSSGGTYWHQSPNPLCPIIHFKPQDCKPLYFVNSSKAVCILSQTNAVVNMHCISFLTETINKSFLKCLVLMKYEV